MTDLSIVSIAVSPNERRLLEAAADRAHLDIDDYIRSKAIEAAGADSADHARWVIAHDDWDRFEAWASAPAKDIPGLRRLAASLDRRSGV